MREPPKEDKPQFDMQAYLK